ncbi:MAG: D-alanine--D-alanine ligase [Clostridia bacterium]|nr:D-alanine--D-alanine ligase [Clostridia bacterium]
MEKIKLAVIFGGKSTEHDVSIVSGMSVLKNINKEKYELYPIYIDEKGKWYKYLKNINEIEIPKIGEKISDIDVLENPIEYLKKMNCVFPVLHGLYGEDGTIQGLLELIEVPYVGCKVLASSISMDKAYAKIIFEKAGLNQAKYFYLKENKGKYIYVDKCMNEVRCTLDEIATIIEGKQKYPMFVKPSNSGSSVGINKVNNIEELKEAIKYAGGFDRKILIEEGIDGREVECAVLGNEEVKASSVGEIKAAGDFYSYDSKYENSESFTVTHADLPKDLYEEIRKNAIKAFKAVDGRGLSRVDFFVENETNKVIINEINTLPGFTSISMYPKLFEEEGIKYDKLLDELVELAME